MTSLTAPASQTVRMSSPRFLWKLRDPLKFLTEVASLPGELITLQAGRRTIVLLKHPSLIQQLLVTEAAHTEKGRTDERKLFFVFFGDGLLNAQGEKHRRQRRMVLPGFHRSRLKIYAQTMIDAAAAASARWKDGEIRDVNAEMTEISLTVIGHTMFSAEAKEACQGIIHAFDKLTASINRLLFPGARWLVKMPLPFARRLRATQRELDATIYDLIRQRRARPSDTGDILSMLMMAEDEEKPGERLSDIEVRDQALTLLFVGLGPIGNTLSWTWWLLAQHPEQEAALHAELAHVLNGRDPTFEDFPKLVVTEQVIRETLRLYPAIWGMGRKPLKDLRLGDNPVPQGSLAVASQWVMHHNAEWFPEPDRFLPSRWTPEFKSNLPRFAYFPFGGGPHSCIGENFAWMELVFILATLAQKWRFTLTPEARTVLPLARITVHPDRKVLMRLERRKTS